ncbi:MAG: S24 family peptidase [Gammaproteobacteria bacterium]|nr:S24 family peptidase [Gammaproteobacteria bacterium]
MSGGNPTGAAYPSPDAVTLRLDDDALAPWLRRGEFVWADPDVVAAPGRVVAVRAADGGGALVRLLVEEGGARVLRALRPGYPDLPYDDDAEGRLIGTVVFTGEAI